MKKRRYEAVGGPLDGLFLYSRAGDFVSAAGEEYEVHGGNTIMVAHHESLAREEEHIYRLAVSHKANKRYWAYVGTDERLLKTRRPRIKLCP